ncbi:hypothetical protein H2200_008016 [Cladophialophora chaetospira]|uniref:Uncharacterized protein n=1 Tax=Cladophialophora chaetospira TaxID=386627 RepID=A0AA38X6V1_9EURO|nr:hypothetical protein H2200_008016 [Cladophialophora chaetospira]
MGTCPNLWCQFAHVGYQGKQVPNLPPPASEDWSAYTLVSPAAEQEHDRMNPFSPKSANEQATTPSVNGQDVDAANNETVDDEMEAVSDTGSFSLQDDFIAL